MKVLYISSLVSDRLFEDFVAKSQTTGFVGQKYHGLFARGLAENLGVNSVTVLSRPPVSVNFFMLKDFEEGVLYRYIPIINICFIKQLFSFIYSFIYTIYWAIKNRGEKKVIVCSIMRLYQYIPVHLASLFFPCKKVTVACDVPWLTIVQVSGATKALSLKDRISIWVSKKLCSIFDFYVLLTEPMSTVLNPNRKPYIVVEGFCDVKMEKVVNELDHKDEKNVIMYAGGLNAAYGILNLVEAVKRLNSQNVELWLFGNGDVEVQLNKESDPRIKYFGSRSNKEIVKAELEATLLINPRPTICEYTHYSFPSKTLEYMASGTYTLTTRLAGIPTEYYDYCGVIEDSSVEGIQQAIEKSLMLGRKELYDRGKKGRIFVLKEKNNMVQTAKVIEFINKFE